MNLDIDCYKFNYEAKPGLVFSEAARRRVEQLEAAGWARDQASSLHHILANSLLSSATSADSEAVLRETFCRDIDIFSLDFEEASYDRDNENYSTTTPPPPPEPLYVTYANNHCYHILPTESSSLKVHGSFGWNHLRRHLRPDHHHRPVGPD